MSPPWMPLYVGDYLADTAHLRTIEHGAYLLLIMHYWRTGGLPDDDGSLARITRMRIVEWRKARPAIEAFFQPGWKHRRIEFEFTEVARAKLAAKKAGIASGQVRLAKSKANLNDRSTDVQRNANDWPTPIPSPSPSPSKKDKEPKEAGASLGACKRASRLSADWWPTLENVNYAIGKGFNQQRISVEAEKFRNYWIAKSGTGATKLDWDATWQNWILNACERNGGPGNGRQTLGDIARELADEVREREREVGLGRPPRDVGSG